MPLRMAIGLDPGHVVLDGDPAPPKLGTQPPIFGPCLLWRNGWMDQDATWYRGRPGPRRHCVTNCFLGNKNVPVRMYNISTEAYTDFHKICMLRRKVPVRRTCS